MSPPEQPKFFLDRSLGRVAVPALLRADGWELVTLAEHYGVPEDERVADTQWIQDAAERGWPILMKDKRIRYRRAEIDAVVRHEARCFVITRGDLASAETAHRFLVSKNAIYEAVTVTGHTSMPSTPTDWTVSTRRDHDRGLLQFESGRWCERPPRCQASSGFAACRDIATGGKLPRPTHRAPRYGFSHT